jgi:hypothetical protein
MTEPSLAEEAAAAAAPKTQASRRPESEPPPAVAGPPAESDTTRWMQKLADDGPESPDSDLDVDDDAPPLAAGTLLTLGLLWLGATMWSAHAELAGNIADATVVLSSAALALPGTVTASLLAGAAAGLTAASRFAGTGPAARRLAVGLAAGTASGGLAAGAIVLAYGGGWAVAAVAITIGVAGMLGGTTAVLPPPALAAGIAGTLGVFVTGVVLSLFQSQLKTLFGAGATVDSQKQAADLYLYAAALVAGLVAGAIAYLFLRRRGPGLPWPAYLLAGATAGLLALIAEALTRIGGARLIGLVSDLSDNDRETLTYLAGARVVSALVVGFAGGLTAMIAVGRTLRRPEGPAA